MGQAKIKRLKQQREAAERAAQPQETGPPTSCETAMPKFVENVRINCDGVIRFGRQQDRRFIALYWHMQDRFGDRAFARQICLHEAAHAELMEQDGIRNVRFSGPEIIYDPTADNFTANGGRASGDDQPNAIVDDDFIFRIVCHMAAGGVALRLAGITETGDDGDFEYFKARYASNPAKSGERPEALWKRAQETVAAKLNEPETKQRVQARADEYFRLLYSSG